MFVNISVGRFVTSARRRILKGSGCGLLLRGLSGRVNGVMQKEEEQVGVWV